VNKERLRQAEARDGRYLPRSILTAEDPAVLWTRYVQLTQIAAVFRPLKSGLGFAETMAEQTLFFAMQDS
jgi:hypothetical protein